MKRKIGYVILSVLLAFFGVFGLTSCKGEEPEVPNTPVEPKPDDKPSTPDKPDVPVINYLTCAEAVSKANEIGEEANPTEKFYVKGKVKSVLNATYGEMTIYDETGELYLYGTYSKDGKLKYSEMTDRPYAGDDITVYTYLNLFNGKPQGKSAWIVDFKHNEVIDDGSYTNMTITEARDSSVSSKVKLEGIVTYKTYGQGFKENGFFLTDGKDSIYVYDSQVTPRVSVGNKVVITGTKEMFIASNEVSSAKVYGYTGSCQISNCNLISSDNKVNDIDLSFAHELTIKELMNKPNNENYRTKIYKVNAFVNKVEGKGFNNYYINDLDDKTGSYVYTSNNGNDFKHLDEFNGKICTVYLSVINMKSTATGCTPRFIPIKVEDNNYKFNLNNTNNFVLEYLVRDLFETSYNADISINVPTSYENTKLGINNVTISYESLTSEFASVVVEGTNTVIKLSNPKAGVAKIKCTIVHNGNTLEHIFNIDMKETPIVDALTVKDASAKLGETVTIKGIAGPSLINQVGFYLIDETGSVAVRINSEDMKNIKFGNLVTISGVVTDYTNKASATNFQRLINNSKLVLNENGEHKYSDKSFINTTFSELLAMQGSLKAEDCLKVFKLKCKIVAETTRFSTNYYITDGTDKIIIYNNAKQSDYLIEMLDKEVEIEFAFCNYNNKSVYPGAILSVTDGVKTIYPMRNYN